MPLNNLICAEFLVWDAVVAWRDYIFSKSFYSCSRGNYFSNMLKLVESNIVDVHLRLDNVNEDWLKESKIKVDAKSEWAKSTRTVRKSCLNLFYKFVANVFDRSNAPYRRHPDGNEIKFVLSSYEWETILKHVLSNVSDKAKAWEIDPKELCDALSKINERDAYIAWLMMHTGQPLEKVLDLRKENLRARPMDSKKALKRGLDPMVEHACMAYLDFDNGNYHIPGHIVDGINKICKDSKHFLFETVNGKRVLRTQVTRNLKQAGRNIGLDLDLTPKLLHGYICAYMTKDKRSIIERSLGLQSGLHTS